MSTVIGIDSSAPIGPMSQTQKKNITNTTHVESDSARPVIVGSRMFSATRFSTVAPTMTIAAASGPDSARARIAGGIIARMRPR